MPWFRCGSIKPRDVTLGGVASCIVGAWVVLVVQIAAQERADPLGVTTPAPRVLTSSDSVPSELKRHRLASIGPAQTVGSDQEAAMLGVAGPVVVALPRMTQMAHFSRIELNQATMRGHFTGYGEPNATVVLLRDGKRIGRARADRDGTWQIAVVFQRLNGIQAFALEQRQADNGSFISGAALQVHVPRGFLQSIHVDVAPPEDRFQFAAVRAEGDDIGSASSRRFDQFFRDQASQPGPIGQTREPVLPREAPPQRLAERGDDVLQPAWDWLRDANRSYHRDILPRIRRGGGLGSNGLIDRDDVGRDEAPEESARPLQFSQLETDRPNEAQDASTRGLTGGLSDWFEAARRGYATEVVPRLKGQVPVGAVRRPPPEPENETADERERRLARERELADQAADRAERERLAAERRRRQAEQARRDAEAESRRIAEESREAARAERLKVEEERQRVAERRATAEARQAREARERAEAERLAAQAKRQAQIEREQDEAERDALQRQRLAELEAEKDQQERERLARLRRDETEQARRDRLVAQAEALRRRLQAQKRREREAALRARARELASRRERLAELEARRDRERAERRRREREAQDARDRAAREERVAVLPSLPGLFQRREATVSKPRLPSLNEGGRRQFTQRETEIVFRSSRDERLRVADGGNDVRSTKTAATQPAVQPSRKTNRRRAKKLASSRRRIERRQAARRSARRHRCHPRAGRKIDPPGTYVVKRGDSLWRISRRHYRLGRLYRRIHRANLRKIRRANLIYPCQRFYLPSKRRR